MLHRQSRNQLSPHPPFNTPSVKEDSLSVHKQVEEAAEIAASKLTGKIAPTVGVLLGDCCAFLGDCSAFLLGDCSAFLGDCCIEPGSAGGGGDHRPGLGVCSINTTFLLHLALIPTSCFTYPHCTLSLEQGVRFFFPGSLTRPRQEWDREDKTGGPGYVRRKSGIEKLKLEDPGYVRRVGQRHRSRQRYT